MPAPRSRSCSRRKGWPAREGRRPGWACGAVATAGAAGADPPDPDPHSGDPQGRPTPPARRTRTPGLRGKWRETDSPESRCHQPASATPDDADQPPNCRPDDTFSPTRRLPTWPGAPPWRQTDSRASPSRQPGGARPGSVATVATNRQPSVTLSPTRRRPAWPSGHTGEKPTTQRHLLANRRPPRPVPGRKPPAPAPPSGVQASWAAAADPVRNKLRWRASTGVRQPVGAAQPGSAATRRSAFGPYRSQPHPPTRMPTQPAATARRHLTPPPPPHSASAHRSPPIAPSHTRQRECQPNRPQPPGRTSHRHPRPTPRWPISHPATPANADANPTGRSWTAPRTRTAAPSTMETRHSAPRTPRRRPGGGSSVKSLAPGR